MLNPYTRHKTDDPMEMIWHNYPIVQRRIFEMFWNFYPVFLHDLFNLRNIKPELPLFCANCYEVSSRLAIIKRFESDRMPIMDV